MSLNDLKTKLNETIATLEQQADTARVRLNLLEKESKDTMERAYQELEDKKEWYSKQLENISTAGMNQAEGVYESMIATGKSLNQKFSNFIDNVTQ